ncbi:MAG TPA: phosphatase PAP2 family protein [Beijerinckiaceae bacterium]|nr:phosphatase PAP2 family protein [Beijerinckiaceae bacterium]
MIARSFAGKALIASTFARLDAARHEFVNRWKAPVRPPQPRGRVIEALLVLLVCLAVVDLFVALTWDAREARWAATLSPAWLHIAEIVTRLGLSGYIFYLSALIAALALLQRGRGAGRVVDAGLGLLAGRAVFVFCDNMFSGIIGSQLIKHLVGRARPHLIDQVGPFHFEPFSFKSTLASFPSGHTITAFTTASALGLFAPKLRIPLYLLASAVALSRLALRAHYPSDVIAGAAIGLVSTWFVGRLFARRRIVFVACGAWFKARGRGMVGHALGGLRLTQR